jgi:hypothetical protein
MAQDNNTKHFKTRPCCYCCVVVHMLMYCCCTLLLLSSCVLVLCWCYYFLVTTLVLLHGVIVTWCSNNTMSKWQMLARFLWGIIFSNIGMNFNTLFRAPTWYMCYKVLLKHQKMQRIKCWAHVNASIWNLNCC